MPESLMNAKQVAEVLGVHTNTVYRLAAEGTLPSLTVVGSRRFRWSEIESFLTKQSA